jgi:hypothetical protein
VSKLEQNKIGMVPKGNIKPFGNGELFLQQRAHFWYLHADRTTSTPGKNLFTLLLLEAGCKGLKE